VLQAANATAGGFALVLLLAGLLLRLPAAIPAAVLVLGAEYAAMLAVEGGILDTRAPALAATLFATAELGYWSLELRDAVADEAGAYARRLGLLSGLTLGALALGELLLVLVDLGERGGIAIEAIGVAAAVGALAIVAASTRQPNTR
jgi:hypothetical protein